MSEGGKIVEKMSKGDKIVEKCLRGVKSMKKMSEGGKMGEKKQSKVGKINTKLSERVKLAKKSQAGKIVKKTVRGG